VKLIITYFDNSKFTIVGDIEILCNHIALQCKHNPAVIKSVRIVPDAKTKKYSKGVR